MYKFENIYSKNDIIKIIVNIVWIDGGISMKKLEECYHFARTNVLLML